jgi:hypothetical protein
MACAKKAAETMHTLVTVLGDGRDELGKEIGCEIGHH